MTAGEWAQEGPKEVLSEVRDCSVEPRGPSMKGGTARVTRGQLVPRGQTRAGQLRPAEGASPGGVKVSEASGQGVGRGIQVVTGRTDWDQNPVALRAKR